MVKMIPLSERVFLVLGFLCLSAHAEMLRENQRNADKVTHFPGLDMPLPSNWYSGYLDYEFQGQQVHTHYVLVEAEDVEGVEDRPLIYWSNGGPGASSLFGLLTELGPLIFSERSLQTDDYRKTQIPTAIYNPFSWSRLGSILIFDQPAPVGFSYCNEDHGSHSCGGIGWTDELTAENALHAMQAFYERYPDYASKDLYLTGESYAGIYIPTFARRIIKANREENTKFPLKGFAVGDGCLGTETGICGELSDPSFVDFWKMLFLAGHGQMPLSSYRRLLLACHHRFQYVESSSLEVIFSQEVEDRCQEELRVVREEVGGYYEYALYDECTYSNGLEHPVQLNGAINDYPCGGGSAMGKYFDLDVVKDALHLQSDFFEVDNAGGDFDYTPTEPDLTGFYKDINGKLKVLIYNGDTDPAITSFAAQNWTSHLGFEVEEEWRPWTVDACQQMGGYVTRYEGQFDFLTIRGAGHLVPEYKPAATFAFIKAWLTGEDYPSFDPACTAPKQSSGVTESNVDQKLLRSRGGSPDVE